MERLGIRNVLDLFYESGFTAFCDVYHGLYGASALRFSAERLCTSAPEHNASVTGHRTAFRGLCVLIHVSSFALYIYWPSN